MSVEAAGLDWQLSKVVGEVTLISAMYRNPVQTIVKELDFQKKK